MKIPVRVLSFIVLIFLSVSCRESDAIPPVPVPEEPSPFVHPGIVISRSHLDYLGEGNDDAYQKLLNFINANPVPDHFHRIVYAKSSGGTPSEDQMRRDADLAYAYALKWARTGAAPDAASAITLLNGWAKTFSAYQIVEGTKETQTQLEATWVAPTFAAAAEIIRHYKINGSTGSGWSEADIEQFATFLVKLRNAQINPLIEAVDAGKRHNNWGVSAGYAKMAIGIFLDNVATYEDGKRVIAQLIPEIVQADGEVLELCARDCHHPQYSMTGLTYAAETERIQGEESIYQQGSRRIKTGWEWIYASYLDQVPCRSCEGKFVFPGAEVAARYYGSSENIERLAALKRPNAVTGSHTFLGFTSFTHYRGP